MIVDVNFVPGPGLPPQELAAEIASQVANPGSALRTSETTRMVQRADVHNGPVAPPGAYVTPSQPPPVPQSKQQEQVGGREPRRVTGDQAGVGLVLREDSAGRQVVRRLVPGQSAAACGVIMIGDLLLSVDSQPVVGSNVMQLIPGTPGSTVELHLHRRDSTKP